MVETAVEIDTLGSRFVKVEAEGLKGDSFELSTPFSRFLAKALEREVHLKILQSLNEKQQENWKRRLDIVCVYTYGKVGGNEALEKKLSMEETGEIFPYHGKALTRARVGQIIIEATNFLYQASPVDLRQQYPNLLNQTGKENGEFMTKKTGITRAIAAAVLQGATYQDLSIKGFTGRGLVDFRKTLAKYGLSVPYPEERYRMLIEDLKALTGKEEKQQIQQVLDRINYDFYHNYHQEFKLYCLLVSDLCTLTGLKRLNGPASGSNKDILQILDRLGIAHSQVIHEATSKGRKIIQRVYFVLAVQQKDAEEKLRNLNSH